MIRDVKEGEGTALGWASGVAACPGPPLLPPLPPGLVLQCCEEGGSQELPQLVRTLVVLSVLPVEPEAYMEEEELLSCRGDFVRGLALRMTVWWPLGRAAAGALRGSGAAAWSEMESFILLPLGMAEGSFCKRELVSCGLYTRSMPPAMSVR